MEEQKEDLQQFRSAIDAIDDRIVDLLKDRLEIVKQVGEYKSKHSLSKSFIRSGREAVMVKDLVKKMGEAFPSAAVANIWRTIISVSLSTEQSMDIYAYSNGPENSCYWRGREYYGGFNTVQEVDSCDEVIKNVAQNTSAVGILPLEQGDEKPWWARPLKEKNDVYIFAYIPFVKLNHDNYPSALAIANVAPEDTGNDNSIFAVHTGINDDEVASIFGDAGLQVNLLFRCDKDILLEAKGFIHASDSKVRKIQEQLSLHNSTLRLMGAYAVPVELDHD